GEAPHLAQPPVQQLGERLRALDRERLHDVRVEEPALVLPALRELADALAAGDREERHVIRRRGAPRRDEVGETEALARRLAREREALGLLMAGPIEDDRVPLGLRREELV